MFSKYTLFHNQDNIRYLIIQPKYAAKYLYCFRLITITI